MSFLVLQKFFLSVYVGYGSRVNLIMMQRKMQIIMLMVYLVYYIYFFFNLNKILQGFVVGFFIMYIKSGVFYFIIVFYYLFLYNCFYFDICIDQFIKEVFR